MADGYFPTLISKDKDPNAVDNVIYTQLSDGTAAIGVTSNALDVNVSNTSIPVSGTVTADQGDAAALTAPWPVILSDGTNAINVTTGSLDVNLTNTSVAVTGTFFQTTQPVSIASTINVDIQDSWAGLTGGGTEAGALRVTIANDSTGVITVDASDLDIRALNLTDDAVKISANGTANSASNPIYVSLGSSVITGEVHSYNNADTSTTTNHDYTVVTAMLVKSIECSASGGAKFELQVGPLASLASKWTGFVPKAGGTISARFDPPIEVPTTSTGTVRIIRTNRESQDQNLYTTIVGVDA